MHGGLAIWGYKLRIQLSNLTCKFLDAFFYVLLWFTNVEAIAWLGCAATHFAYESSGTTWILTTKSACSIDLKLCRAVAGLLSKVSIDNSNHEFLL
jgi:hypothetical protein